MNFNFDKKSLGFHALAILFLIIIATGFCAPEMNGNILSQDDNINYKFLSAETIDYRETHDDEPMWTSRVFSGMPTFFITYVVKTNIARAIDLTWRDLFSPTIGKIFILFIGFYILMISLGVNKWLALIGAIGYGLSSNLIVSIIAGHNTKVFAIAYMAPAIAGVLLTYMGKKNTGAILTLIFSSLLIKSGHYQIVYYFILISLIVSIVFFIDAIKKGATMSFIQSSILLILSGFIAVLPNSGTVYSAYEHQAETIRGGELRINKKENNKDSKSGLDKDYAMKWSYGPLESLTIVIPSFEGGSSNESLPNDGAVAKTLNKFNLQKAQKEQLLKYGPLYTGEQPFILGTVYFGTVFIFLFILSLFIIKGPLRNIAISILILFLIISWGRHADAITGLFYEFLPGYNKFRTPSMAMAVLGILIPSFGIFGLSKIFRPEYNLQDFKKHFKYAIMIMGGLMIMLLLFGLTTNWIGSNDAQVQTRQPWSIDEIYDALLVDRKSRFMNDWVIAAITLLIAWTMIWMHKMKKVSFSIAVTILGLVIGIDMWRVAKRYLNEDSFVKASTYDKMMKPTVVDNEILADKSGRFRVLDLSLNPWTDGRTSYFHENIGGHHAAKLQRYQDLIEYELSPEMQKLNGLLRQSETGIRVAPGSASEIPALSMLNAKYLVLKPNQAGGKALNPNVCGNAWFVNNVKFEETGMDEMNALRTIDPHETAILNTQYKDKISDTGKGNNATIIMTSFEPNEISYRSNNSENGLGVFSEIYYENGWKAYIDNLETPIIRANYVLRALSIPSGEHNIRMKFEPDSHLIGKNLSLFGSILYILFIGGLIYVEFKQKKNIA